MDSLGAAIGEERPHISVQLPLRLCAGRGCSTEAAAASAEGPAGSHWAWGGTLRRSECVRVEVQTVVCGGLCGCPFDSSETVSRAVGVDTAWSVNI